MKRRLAVGPPQPFPEHLLDVPLPLSPEDREAVDKACEAAGWGPVTYLQHRVIRKRAWFAARRAEADYDSRDATARKDVRHG